jgi:hypothetical protein
MRNRTVIDPKCVTCGKPTKRHYVAKYCWECMKKSNDEAYKRRKKADNNYLETVVNCND